MVEHPNPSQPNPGAWSDGTPCTNEIGTRLRSSHPTTWVCVCVWCCPRPHRRRLRHLHLRGCGTTPQCQTCGRAPDERSSLNAVKNLFIFLCGMQRSNSEQNVAPTKGVQRRYFWPRNLGNWNFIKTCKIASYEHVNSNIFRNDDAVFCLRSEKENGLRYFCASMPLSPNFAVGRCCNDAQKYLDPTKFFFEASGGIKSKSVLPSTV